MSNIAGGNAGGSGGAATANCVNGDSSGILVSAVGADGNDGFGNHLSPRTAVLMARLLLIVGGIIRIGRGSDTGPPRMAGQKFVHQTFKVG